MAQQSPATQHLNGGTMRKILCPHCGTINLEKFVTFPHCANCGTLLPAPETISPSGRAWRGPLKPLLWLAVLSCATLGLIVAAALFQGVPPESGQVLIYGQLSRTARVGQLMQAHFTVDTIGAPESRVEDTLNEVKLRVPRDFFDAFDFVALDPVPDEVINRGSGRYFSYAALPRETRLQLMTRARRSGRHILNIQIYAAAHSPGKYRTAIIVEPGTSRKDR